MTTRPRRSARRDPARPLFDRLEPRLALSTGGTVITVVVGAPKSGGPSVVSTAPAPGSIVARTPSTIAVTFDRPILPSSLSDDFRLALVAADGTEATVAQGIGLGESFGASPKAIDVTPAAPLGPGEYRLYLLGTSGLSGFDGKALVPGDDRRVDDFTVAAPTSGPAPAIDLGSPVGSVVTASGSLDLADDPEAADSYKVELPQGHFWRLGVEVDDHRIGSPLASSLAVYDASGNKLTAADDHLPGDPDDPYLFVGLNPGTYTIKVSGGDGVVAEASGAYRLRVVADPADAATSVTSAALAYADPSSRVPTGLTLRFSGPMDTAAMAGNVADLVRLVDDSGRSWAVDATGYSTSATSLALVFDRALPAGHYTAVLAGQGALVDLVGKPPVAPGLPAGALARFAVTTAPGPVATDYGPVFPRQVEDGISAILHLAPGQEVTYRFVLTVGGTYDLATTFGGSSPTFTARVGGRDVTLDPGSEGVDQRHRASLPAGVVTLRVEAGPRGSTIDWSLLLSSGLHDVLLDNGVGQASALGLRLVAPDPLGGGAPATGPAGVVDGPSPSAASATGPASTSGPSPTASASSTSPGGPTAAFASGAGLIGHPSAMDDAIAVVGPVAPGGMTALSTSAPGLPTGLSIGLGQRGFAPGNPNSGALRGLLDVPEPEATDPASPDAVTSIPAPTAAGDLPPLPEALVEPPAAPSPEVTQAPGLVDRVSATLAGLVPSRRRASDRPGPADLDDAALADLGRDPGRDALPEGEETVETADLSSPLGLGVLVVAAAGGARRVGRWLGRGTTRIAARVGGPAPSGPRRPSA